MTINYIPNDPLTQAFVPFRKISPRPGRALNQAGFKFFGAVAEDEYELGTPEFLFWQCRESAIATLDVWEALHGPLQHWHDNKKTLELKHNNGAGLNAFYNRSQLLFFEDITGGKTTLSGMSTDVVAHEVGHGLLDALRPDLFNSSTPETDACHEAFGDIMAILTALSDQDTRVALLAESADLGNANFVEGTMEDLSDGVRRALGPTHGSSEPRRALNQFQWTLPSLLPTTAAPAQLSAQFHSFGRIFSGCFYDLIRNLFNSRPVRDEQTLLACAQTAGRILVGGLETAPHGARFFQAVGRAMIFADDEQNGGANHLAIRNAFSAHNIALGSSAMLAPNAGLAGAAPTVTAANRAAIATATRKDLLARLGLPSASKLVFRAVRMAGEIVTEAIHNHEVTLDKIDKRLKGVVAQAPVSALLGAVENRAAILGALPDFHSITDEVNKYVEVLLKHDNIRFKKSQSAVSEETGHMRTHEIKTSGSKKVLTRVAFDCFSGGRCERS